jgi:cell division protein FtsW (lipid II flippase)
VLAGIFPLHQDAAGRVYDPLGVHSANGRIFFLGIGVALVVVALRLKGDPMWRNLAPYTLATGIALLVLFAAVGALAVPADAPLHNWLGLVQRLVLAVWLPCIVVLALRLRRGAAGTGKQ